jgi:hypothetical protein
LTERPILKWFLYFFGFVVIVIALDKTLMNLQTVRGIIMADPRLKELAKHNAIIMGTLLSGGDAVDCVVALNDAFRQNTKRMLELEMMVPRKIKAGDKVFVWRCPEELIPLDDFNNTWSMPQESTEGEE